MLSLHSYLVVAALLFCMGLFAVLTRKNAIGVLMGIELILNAANVNLVAFNRFSALPSSGIQGQGFIVFVIILAAAEAAVMLAIILAIYARLKSIELPAVSKLKG